MIGTKRSIKNILLVNLGKNPNLGHISHFGPLDLLWFFKEIFDSIMSFREIRKMGLPWYQRSCPPCFFCYWFLISKFCWISWKVLWNLGCVYHHLFVCLIKLLSETVYETSNFSIYLYISSHSFFLVNQMLKLNFWKLCFFNIKVLFLLYVFFMSNWNQWIVLHSNVNSNTKIEVLSCWWFLIILIGFLNIKETVYI